MNKEQIIIEEMAIDVMNTGLPLELAGAVATYLYNAGYRKEIKAEWIFVEDRLPTETGKCWVYDGEEVLILRFCARWTANDINGFNKGNFTYWDGDFYVPTRKKITHWMPYFVPEPPKMRGE